MNYLLAFVIGGLLCTVAQLVMDLSKLPPGHVMVLFVSLGAIASGLGLYAPLIKLAGAGATIPLPSFGHSLVQGIVEDMGHNGWSGLLTGGLRATSMGVSSAVLFGLLAAVFFNPKN